MGLWVMGWAIYSAMIIAVNLRLAFEVKLWNWPIHVAIWLSIAATYIWGAIYSPLWPTLPLGYNMLWVFYETAAEPFYWISVWLGAAVALLPSFFFVYLQRTYFPSDYHIIQEQD